MGLAFLVSLTAACFHDDSDGGGASSGGCADAEKNLDATSKTATYCVTFSAHWTKKDFSEVPDNAHFTDIVGAAVSPKADMWESGALASAGLEVVAEEGKTAKYKAELNEAVKADKAANVFVVKGTGATGSRSFEVEVDQDFYAVNFATMVAPSPDWFVGVSEYALMDAAGWIEDSGKVDLKVYDAGTESGKDYSLDNKDTKPAHPIITLFETVAGSVDYVDGLVDGNPIATVKFERIK